MAIADGLPRIWGPAKYLMIFNSRQDGISVRESLVLLGMW